ncbi:hypothetical protein HO498_04535 [Streptococcus suis]|nr:hypothetical protein [Streptococcus suis]
METLTIKNVPLLDEGSIINLSYTFSSNNTYIIYSKHVQTIRSLSNIIFYCEDDLVGDLYYCGIDLRGFDKTTYRKCIISKVGNDYEYLNYLTALEYLKLYSLQEDKISYYLRYFSFPIDKIDKQLKDLADDEKLIIELAKPYIKGSQIILFDLFFDNLQPEIKYTYLKKIKYLNKSLGITQIIFSNIDDWNNDEFFIIKLIRE